MSNFNLKKQIYTLYLTGVLGNLSITGAWVAILSARGFSLAQIGFAETIFHLTSLICEIPSGMLADVYGRMKMLMLGNIMMIIGDLIMAFSNGFFMVCLSMPFHAMSYNFASGSGDALAYDSMKIFNKESGYERYSSNQFIIFRVVSGISTMCAGVALMIGYRGAYLISAAMNLITLFFTTRLVEARVDSEENTLNKELNSNSLSVIFKNMIRFFDDSLHFLRKNTKATRLMFLNSFVGAIDVLLLFFLQSKIRDTGLNNLYLGAALFIMQLGGIVGARLIVKAKKARYVSVFIICTLGVMAGVLLEHTGIAILMVLGGFLSSMADDAIEIRTGAKLQEMFPSDQRATLLSVSSFTFSVIMIVLSPLAGLFFEIW
ncbi:MAG: MFS transporter [Eubacterium sp.]|nr:MFS transporter [Eubacterium sp.]